VKDGTGHNHSAMGIQYFSPGPGQTFSFKEYLSIHVAGQISSI
jgi:hypothetical protein